MSGFLAQLAGIALGAPTKGAARPLLPPRHAPSPALDAALDAAGLDEDLGAPPRPPAPRADTDIRIGSADRARDPADAAPAAAHRDPRPAAPLPGNEAERAPLPVDRAIDPGPVASPSRVETAPSRPAKVLPEPLAVEPMALDPRSPPLPAMAASDTVQPANAVPNAPFVPPRPIAISLAPAQQPPAPLSDGAMAGRAERPRAAEPVIHVTIDRVEVRTPATMPPPPKRRPPAEPSVSLADFLRGDGPGTRQ